MKRSTDEVLISALRTLANDIQSVDGVANAVILEAAGRLDELVETINNVIDDNLDLCDGEVCKLRQLVVARDAGK